MAFYKVDGRAEELTSWISLSYVCQGENLLIFIELLLIRVQFKTLLNQNKNEGQNMDGVYESKSGIFLLYFNNTLDCRT